MWILRNGSKELMKEINRYKVLNIIRHQHPISRGEIAKQYDLGVSTLSYIIEELKNRDLIYEVGVSTSTGGRRPKLIEFNKNYGYIASLKIEEEQILLALTNMDAEIIEKKRISFPKNSLPEVVVDIIEKETIQILEDNDIDVSKLLGIGLLSSGLVNRHEGSIIRSSMLGWRNVQITKMLKERFEETQIYVDNNINGHTLAELSKGEGQKSSNFLVVSVGAGLGLSVVIDRKIYYGSVGGAGEFGHTTMVIDGYPCHCGQNGCLEMYASESYFENKGKELISDFPGTSLKDFSYSEVARCADQNDKLATLLIDEMSHYLGHGIRNLINTFNPEKIVIAGEAKHYSHLFINHVREVAQENFFSKVDLNTDIVLSTLNDDSWLIGGALLAINQIFQEPIYEKRDV